MIINKACAQPVTNIEVNLGPQEKIFGYAVMQLASRIVRLRGCSKQASGWQPEAGFRIAQSGRGICASQMVSKKADSSFC